MPTNQYVTLKDITALDALSHPGSVGLVEDVINYAPELDVITGRPIEGISYPAAILTAVGSNGAFRKVNSGVPLSAFSADEKVFNTFPFDIQMSVDEAILDRRAAAGESNAFVLTTHATAAMRQKAIYIGRQFYLGSAQDQNGPPGCFDFLYTQRTQVDSRTGKKINQYVEAGGNIAGGCEMVWFLKLGPQGVGWLFGKGRGIYMNPWQPFNLDSPDSTKANPKISRQWRANVFGWLGTTMAQVHAIGAIGNVTPFGAQTTNNGVITVANGLTDALIAQLWASFPVTIKPDIALCTQNAAWSLQLSRGVTNFVSGPDRNWTAGAAPIANFSTRLPTAGNIPLIVTDNITPGGQFVPN